jgi:hypothetical protein
VKIVMIVRILDYHRSKTSEPISNTYTLCYSQRGVCEKAYRSFFQLLKNSPFNITEEMKNRNYLDIQVPKGSAFNIKTENSFVKLHQLMCVVGCRGSGKSVFITNFLRMMKDQNCLDRLILVTPTFASNKAIFHGLPVNEQDVIDPNDPTAVQQIRDIVDSERDILDEYFEKLKRWKALQKEINSRKNIDDIDEDLLLEFGSDLQEKPTHYLNGRKPVIACFVDDALGTRIYGPKSGLNNLCILHRHLGVSEHLGALGITMLFSTQSYRSNVYGISPTIRNNCTSIAIFKTKSNKELMGIAEEIGGFCTVEEFMEYYEMAMNECGCGCKSAHNILFVDTSPYPGNSNFRKNLNKMLYLKGDENKKN